MKENDSILALLMAAQNGGSGGGGDPGYTVEETLTTIIPEQTVTTVVDGGMTGALLTLADGVSVNFQVGDTLSITINGETKNVAAETASDTVFFTFSGNIEEPQNPGVFLYYQDGLMAIMTTGLPEATYTISAELVTRTVTPSPEFQEAVAKSTEPLVVTLVPSDPESPFNGTYVGATAEEIRTAFLLGRKIFAKLGNTYITPYLLDGDALVADFIYNVGSTVLYVHSVINVADGANTYNSYAYIGLQIPG